MEPCSAPGKKELRSFGLTMAAFIALVFAIVVPWLRNSAWPVWPWLVAGALVGAALTVPAALRPIYTGWMYIARVLNWIVSRVTLLLVYYAVVAPMGIAMRALGKDPLRRRFEQEAETYRVPTPPPDRKHLERPF